MAGPLSTLTVVELAGICMRLADRGARVIRVDRTRTNGVAVAEGLFHNDGFVDSPQSSTRSASNKPEKIDDLLGSGAAYRGTASASGVRGNFQ